ncbi:MAG TPA: peroxiredoxin-like family protein [Bacteroidales bacterium]|nr:peroxiredoxin-like family protein [Bacteroidales bacterium]
MKNVLRLALVFTIISFSAFTYGQAFDYARFGMNVSEETAPAGLQPGDKAPDFVGYDQNGIQVELNELLKEGPVVLFFYRGKWCTVCSKVLNDYQDSLNVITGMGFRVIAITPESIENVEQTVKMHNLTYTVIYDCQEKIMKDYDVMFSVTKDYQDKLAKGYSIDIAKNNGREAANLPVPATYIMNKDGIITAVYFNPDYRSRASVKWILTNLGGAL